MKKLIIIFLLLFAVNGYCETSVYFSPNGGCQRRIIEKIDEAEQFIKIAMYAWTSPELLEAVERANSKGVLVYIILDKVQAAGRHSLSKDILKDREQWEVKIIRGKNGGIMHHKICLIDDKYLISGSFNWTASAELRNYENVIIFDKSERNTINKFEAYYNFLWRSN